MRYKITTCLMATLMVLSLLVGCNTAGPEQEDVPEGQGTEPQLNADLLDEVLFTEAQTTTIALSGTSADIDGPGATVSGGRLTLTDSRRYVLSGTFTGGVVVDATEDDLVEIVLDGVTIAATENAAIYAKRQDLLVITLAVGSSNTLTDADAYTYADDGAEEPDAALFSKHDLTIRGSGSLVVNANVNNGIGSKDDLVIEGGSIAVTAANHGIRGRDSLTIYGGTFDIAAGNDGLQSNNDGDGKGWIRIEGGDFTIRADHDGIQAESDLTVEGGTFRIVTGGGSGATGLSGDGSYKGLKADANISLLSGTFDLDCADDGIHSNGTIAVSGGTITIASGDDGIHADEHLEISAGAIDITESYEGLEAMTMTISGGVINIRSSDDGINISGGTDSGGGGRFGRDNFGTTDDKLLNITGGTITISATGGDAIDSNGNITMSGGYVIAQGPANGPDVAIDFDGTFTMTGGTLIGIGNSGMAQAPGSTSTQPGLQLYLTANAAAGSKVKIADSDGNIIMEVIAERAFNNIVYCGPELTVGETYAVSAGDLDVNITLSDVVTRVSESGEAVTGGMFGGGGFGGGNRPGGNGIEGGMPPGGPGGGGARPNLPEGERPEGMTGGPGGGGRPGGGDMGGAPPEGDPPTQA